MRYRAKSFMVSYLKCEFEFKHQTLILLEKGKNAKEIVIDKNVTIVQRYDGIFVLKGRYSWRKLNMSKFSPFGIPLKENCIYIPSCVNDYDILTKAIYSEYNKSATID